MLFGKNIYDCESDCKTRFLAGSKIYVDETNFAIYKDGIEGTFGIVTSDVYETVNEIEFVNLLQRSEFDYADAVEEDKVKQVWHLDSYGDSIWQLAKVDEEALVRLCTGGPVDPPVAYLIDEAFNQTFSVVSDGTFELSVDTSFSFRNSQLGAFTVEFIRNAVVETTINLQPGQNTLNVDLQAGTYTMIIRYVDEIPAGFSPVQCVTINNIFLQGNQVYSNEVPVGKFLNTSNAESGCYSLYKSCSDTIVISDFHEFDFNTTPEFITNTYIEVGSDPIFILRPFNSCGNWEISCKLTLRDGADAIDAVSYTINGVSNSVLPFVPLGGADEGVVFTVNQDDINGYAPGLLEFQLYIDPNDSYDLTHIVLYEFIFTTYGVDKEELISEFCIEQQDECLGEIILDVELECAKFNTPEGARYLLPISLYLEPVEFTYSSEEYFDTNGFYKKTKAKNFKTTYDFTMSEISYESSISVPKLLASNSVILHKGGEEYKVFLASGSVNIELQQNGCFRLTGQLLVEEDNSGDCCC